MIDKIKGLLTEKVGFGSIAIFLIVVIVCILLIYFFCKIAKACFDYERISGIPSHTLIKTVIIALFPTIYSIVDIMNIGHLIPEKILIPVCIVPCLIVTVWNFWVYGLIGGLMFTIVHIVFGAIASLGISALVFIVVAGVILMLFGGSVGGSASSSGSSVPSLIRDVSNGQTYHVVKGANGEYYVEDHGRSSVLRSSDYSGEYFDDYGNRYVK